MPSSCRTRRRARWASKAARARRTSSRRSTPRRPSAGPAWSSTQRFPNNELFGVGAIDEDRIDERAAAHVVALLRHELQGLDLEVPPAELLGLGDDHVGAKALEVERAQDRQVEALGIDR